MNKYHSISRSCHRRCSVKKGVLKHFANATGKHLCWSLLLTKFHAFRPATFLMTSCDISYDLHKYVSNL